MYNLQTIAAMRKARIGKDAEFEARHVRDEHGKFSEGAASKPVSVASVNAALAAKYGKGKAVLRRGKGYYYFTGDAVEGAHETGVYVAHVGQLSLERWLKEAGEKAEETKRSAGENSKGSGDEGQFIYHVTRTDAVPSIKDKGLLPMQTSNWVKGDSKERYGNGEVYAFTDPHDAARWAAKMDMEFNKDMGSGKISVVKLKRTGDWEKDPAQEQSVVEAYDSKGQWLRRKAGVSAADIVASAPVTLDHARKVVGDGLKDRDLFGN